MEPQTLRQLFVLVNSIGLRAVIADQAGDKLKADGLRKVAVRHVGIFLDKFPEQQKGWETLVALVVKSLPKSAFAGKLQ